MSHSKARRQRLTTLCAATVMLAATLAYLPGIDGYFLQDDFAATGQFFGRDGTFVLPGRPAVGFPSGLLPFWSHLLDSYFWGQNPVGHHLTNLLLHTLAATLVFALVRRLMRGTTAVAFFTALFFALCPLHENAVGWISGRALPLATVLLLLATLVCLRSAKAPILAASCYVGALLSHPVAITLPLLVVLLDTFGMRRSIRSRFAAVHLPLLVLMVAYYGLMRFSDQRLWRADAVHAVLGPRVLLDTMMRLLVPVNEALTNPAKVPILKWAAFGVALPLQVIILIVRRAAPPRIFFVGLLWFVLAFVPVAAAARLGPSLAESRLFYAAMAPLYLMVAATLFADAAPFRPRAPGPSIRAAVASVLFCALLTVLLWKNKQAYAGAERLVRHVQAAAASSVREQPPETLVFIIDPPATFGGAPVFSRGLRESLQPPYYATGEVARQMRTVTSANTRPLIEHLEQSTPQPLVVMWMPTRGWYPSASFVAVSPVFPAAGEQYVPYRPPRFTGRSLGDWLPQHGFSGETDEHAFHGRSAGNDPQFLSPPLVVPRRWLRHVEVRMSVQGVGQVPVDLFWNQLARPLDFAAERRVRRMLAADGRVHTLVFPLPASRHAREEPGSYLARLRLDPCPAPLPAIVIESIALVPGPECPGLERLAVAWEGSKLELWTRPPGVTTALEGSDLALRTSGNDPYLMSPALAVDGGEIRAVEVILRVDSPNDQAALYWTTGRAPTYSENMSRRFRVHTGDHRFHRYLVQFTGQHRLPPGRSLTGIRLDPMAGPGAAWIRSIRIYRAAK